jgi:hypothetical protein
LLGLTFYFQEELRTTDLPDGTMYFTRGPHSQCELFHTWTNQSAAVSFRSDRTTGLYRRGLAWASSQALRARPWCERLTSGTRIDASFPTEELIQRLGFQLARRRVPHDPRDCWPSRSDSHCPMIRAAMSVVPAAGKPTMMRTGRDGYVCAQAIRDTAGRATAPRSTQKSL